MKNVPEYSELAADEIDRAEAWANKENVAAEDRERFVQRFMQRAQVYALLAVAQELSRLPANMPEYLVNFSSDD